MVTIWLTDLALQVIIVRPEPFFPTMMEVAQMFQSFVHLETIVQKDLLPKLLALKELMNQDTDLGNAWIALQEENVMELETLKPTYVPSTTTAKVELLLNSAPMEHTTQTLLVSNLKISVSCAQLESIARAV